MQTISLDESRIALKKAIQERMDQSPERFRRINFRAMRLMLPTLLAMMHVEYIADSLEANGMSVGHWLWSNANSDRDWEGHIELAARAIAGYDPRNRVSNTPAPGTVMEELARAIRNKLAEQPYIFQQVMYNNHNPVPFVMLGQLYARYYEERDDFSLSEWLDLQGNSDEAWLLEARIAAKYLITVSRDYDTKEFVV